MIRYGLRILILFLVGSQIASAQVGSSRTIAKGLSNAVAIDITPAGEILILEAGRDRVLKLSTDGQRIDSLGGRGSGDYQFDRPTALDGTNGMKIYVADPNNNRIQTFDKRSQHLGAITLQDDRSFGFDPHKVRVNRSGEVITWLAAENMLIRFGHMGRPDLEIGPLQRFGIKSISDYLITSNYIFIADGQQGVLHRLSLQGEYQQFFSGFTNAISLASHSENVVVLTNSAILMCNSTGKLETKLDIPLRSYVGMRIWGGEIFLLTNSTLFAVRLP
jgi:hypothetical protein